MSSSNLVLIQVITHFHVFLFDRVKLALILIEKQRFFKRQSSSFTWMIAEGCGGYTLVIKFKFENS